MLVGKHGIGCFIGDARHGSGLGITAAPFEGGAAFA